MLISFVISTTQKEDNRVLKTLTSLDQQTSIDYEVILINDNPSISKEEHDALGALFIKNKRLVLVDNSKPQSDAFNWNLGVSLARGTYVVFVKEGDVLNPSTVETIKKVSQKATNKAVDVIQFQRKLIGLYEVEKTPSVLIEDYLYDLSENKEVFAYVDATIYNKAFRTSLLIDDEIKFKPRVRYDALFLYDVLAKSDSFYNLGANLLTNTVSIPRYSVFDVTNQWPHILNNYRRMGIYKTMRDEITYAQFYNLYANFLGLIKRFKNKTLYKKALIFVRDKYEGRIDLFVRTNPIFKEAKHSQFNGDFENFNSFIKTELKKNR
ncbi:hypothetical protein LD125_00063 [Mesoplasma sp. JKS002658]|uniref:glycosyltransferase family 2 protein n=1 Tax=Mesoplasma whartonense TaxID=2878854 RepID=UPI0020229C73|nr:MULTISPECIES: glycosyltransferase [unclassified Mesoplasma]MCL8211688.1 hypothetical protein [Mesoplasma sp. JKS002664]MCL8212065.1 hypothetical protein [Mesoplasma sp. JKS002662]MCL8213696.1 hypothetical protein [Mesoplasma sp. JKS002660]MCL8213830.1 hypothetical protein [Mesoplasma sp. JKS002658]MCL8215024.1 hypothetical protein [Mesoplasma sp. JKS002663]